MNGMRGSLQRIMALARLAVVDLFRRRDVSVALLLAAVALLPLLAFNFFGVSGVWRYVGEVTLLLVWIFSIAIGLGVAARQFPAEFDSRTIYPLLSKPVRRTEILLGKFLGAFLATASALCLFYVCFLLLLLLKGGGVDPVVVAQAFLFHLLFVMLLTAMAVTGSLILTPSANLTVCALAAAGMLLFGERLAGLAAGLPLASAIPAWAVHALAPHMEFFDLRLRVVHGWPPVEWPASLAVAAYALCYTAALLLLADRLFKRKKL